MPRVIFSQNMVALPKQASAHMAIHVGIIMGSDSDLPVMAEAAKVLEELGIRITSLPVVSAHRTPKRLYTYSESAAE